MILPTILAAFVGCSTMLMLSVVRWIKRDPAARYYTVAWVFMLFGGIVLALSKFTVLPRNLITENATQVGSALGVILLSIALADRITGRRNGPSPPSKDCWQRSARPGSPRTNLCESSVKPTPCWSSGCRSEPVTSKQ